MKELLFINLIALHLNVSKRSAVEMFNTGEILVFNSSTLEEFIIGIIDSSENRLINKYKHKLLNLDQPHERLFKIDKNTFFMAA